VFGAATLMSGGVNFIYNALVMGDPWAFPLNEYYEQYFGPKSNAMGFGPERGLGWAIDAFPGHSPLEAVINAALNACSLNVELFGWGMGSLLLAAVAVAGWRQSRRGDYFMLAVVAAVVGIFSFYWFGGGPDFGARYWFLMIVPLVALSVRGLLALEDKLAPDAVGMATVLVLCLFAITLVNYLPWRSLDKYFHYLDMRPDVQTLAKAARFDRSLVLVQGRLFPDYQSAWVYNPLLPNAGQPVYAWDKSPEVRRQLLRAYHDRPVWILEGPARTGGGYRIAGGPTPASILLERDAETTRGEKN